MSYNAEKDFIERTIKILDQYDNYLEVRRLPDAEKFEETLFVNCLIGLRVVIEREYRKVYPDAQRPQLKIKNVDGVEFILDRQLIRMLRNALNHEHGPTHENVRLMDLNLDHKIDAIHIPHDGIGTLDLQTIKPVIKEMAL